MELITIRRIFPDKWIKIEETKLQALLRCPPSPLAWFLPPVKGKEFSFTNYILGYRVEASEEEVSAIQNHNMLLQPFVQLRKDEPAITFAEMLGPDWIAEVQPSQTALLQVELELKTACVTWTQFFESLGE